LLFVILSTAVEAQSNSEFQSSNSVYAEDGGYASRQQSVPETINQSYSPDGGYQY
jgi:hypothetical protein